MISFTVANCTRDDPIPVEMQAINVLMQISRGEEQYKRLHGRYAPLYELGPDGEKLVPRPASEAQEAYAFHLVATEQSYHVRAMPRHKQGGRRSFYLDESGKIRESWMPETAGPESHLIR